MPRLSSNEPVLKYVGEDRAEVVRLPLENDAPTWVIRKFERLARAEGISYYDFVAKYDPSFFPDEWDDGPEHSNQAWA